MKVLKKIISVLLIVSAIFTMCFPVSAAEYIENAPVSVANVKLRWVYRESSKYTQKVYNGLPSSYGPYVCINNGIAKLGAEVTEHCDNIRVQSSPYAGSNVRFSVPNSSSWEILNMNELFVFATTIPRSTSGTFYYGYNSFDDNDYIFVDFAMIWYSPEYYPSYHSDMVGQSGNRMAMHEMMHAFGMGHTTRNSIMTENSSATSTSLTTYDISEFARMYP